MKRSTPCRGEAAEAGSSTFVICYQQMFKYALRVLYSCSAALGDYPQSQLEFPASASALASAHSQLDLQFELMAQLFLL